MAEGTELAKYYVQIVPSAKGISGGIKEALGGDAEAEGAGASLGGSLISGIKKIIGAAAIGKVLKDSISAGANLEQSFGGLDTIYGNSSGKMKEFAAEASRAGISMNTYAEQAVSMGAALKNALGGDTATAAAKANVAIMDMADNAAKMGTDITSLQNAYTGFSRGNFTMLDNLSLGFAGTKEGMQQLLDKAKEFSGVEYDIDSYADIVDAIHVVQENMGIAGVAADEAATTISGSLGSVKASWENLMALMTTGGDVRSAMKTLVGNVSAFFFGNLLPALGRIAVALPGALATGIVEGIPLFMNNIRLLLNQARNAILFSGNLESIGTDAIVKFVGSLINDAGLLIEGLWLLISTAAKWIVDNFGTIFEAVKTVASSLISTGSELIGNLLEGFKSRVPDILASAFQIVLNIAQGIIQNLPQILQTGITIIGKLIAGVLQAIPTLLAALPKIVTSISNFFKNTDWASIGRNIITGIKNGLVAAGHMLWDAVKGILGSFKENVLAFFGIHSPSRWGAYVGEMIDAGFAGGVTGNASMVQKAVEELQTRATKPITTMLTTQAAITNDIANSGTGSAMNQMLNLLSVIAEKDTKIILNNREVNRSLREMGVAYV